MAGGNTTTDDETIVDDKLERRPVIAVSLLQPRIAVVLGVPKHWHYPLSICRLLSIAPAIAWGLRFALRFLIQDFLRSDAYGYGLETLGFEQMCKSQPKIVPLEQGERRLRLTETALSIIWVSITCRLRRVELSPGEGNLGCLFPLLLSIDSCALC